MGVPALLMMLEGASIIGVSTASPGVLSTSAWPRLRFFSLTVPGVLRSFFFLGAGVTNSVVDAFGGEAECGMWPAPYEKPFSWYAIS